MHTLDLILNKIWVNWKFDGNQITDISFTHSGPATVEELRLLFRTLYCFGNGVLHLDTYMLEEEMKDLKLKKGS